MKEKITEILGWYGVVAVVSAYALLSLNIISNNSLLFQGLNLTGAIGITIDALEDKNTQPAVLNIIWALIALIAIIKIALQFAGDGGIGHRYFSAEKSRDPGSARQPPSSDSSLTMQ